MASTVDDQRARISEAFRALVEARVQERLPADRAGLRAIEPIRSRSEAVVEDLLERAVERIAREVAAELDPATPNAGPPPDGRLKVLTNDAPCDVCSRVRRVAVHEYVGGERVLVECELCASDDFRVRS